RYPGTAAALPPHLRAAPGPVPPAAQLPAGPGPRRWRPVAPGGGPAAPDRRRPRPARRAVRPADPHDSRPAPLPGSRRRRRARGVASTASDAEVKRAYRKLMSENHPDKLMGQGVPEDMIQLATERSQEIQTAYDLITKHRARG